VTGAALWQHTMKVTEQAFEARRSPGSRNRSSTTLSRSAFEQITARQFIEQMQQVDDGAASSPQSQRGKAPSTEQERVPTAPVSFDDPSPKAAQPKAPQPKAPPPAKAAPAQLKQPQASQGSPSLVQAAVSAAELAAELLR